MSSGPTLLRQLGLASATAIVISNMIGAGIFTTTGFLAGDLGQPRLVLLIWLSGAIFALAGAFCYSELGVNFPASGGEYVYLTRAFGPTLGFMSGWTSFFAGFSAPIAATALACADYAGYFYPALRQQNEWVRWGAAGYGLRVGGAQVAAAALILLFTLLNVFGVKRIARVQNTLTAVKIAMLVAFIVLGLALGEGHWSHLTQTAVRTSTTSLPAQFVISLFWIYFAYSGWNAATYVAEELKRPERTLPLALTVGTLAVAGLYLALNVVFLYAAPLETMKGVVAVGSLAAERLFGAAGGALFSALVALSLMASVNAMVTIGPRLYYAMAKNGAFLQVCSRVHPRWRTPVAAIVFQGLCAALMTLVDFGQLVLYIGYLLNLFAVLAVVSLFHFRKRPGWKRLAVVDYAWPLVPLVFVVPGVWMTLYGMRLEPLISLAAAATLASGALVYRLRQRGPGAASES
jgi:APA family basic amino acid/polyamine antiporter